MTRKYVRFGLVWQETFFYKNLLWNCTTDILGFEKTASFSDSVWERTEDSYERDIDFLVKQCADWFDCVTFVEAVGMWICASLNHRKVMKAEQPLLTQLSRNVLNQERKPKKKLV